MDFGPYVLQLLSGLSRAMEARRIGEADLDPGRELPRQVSNDDGRFVARRHALCERDALVILEAVRQHPYQHVLGRFGGMSRH